jgi:hypothetical protein
MAPARLNNVQPYSISVVGGTSAAAGGTSVGTTCNSVGAAGGFLVAAAFQAAALRSPVFAAFVPAAFNFRVLGAFSPTTLNFRVRVVFFAAELRLVGMGNFLSRSDMWHRPYNAKLRFVQGVQISEALGLAYSLWQ